jgi:MFS family permease
VSSPTARAARGRTFDSLAVPNYRRFFTGQAISLIGTWMQRFAQTWLVFQISDSATVVGLVAGLQALPLLVLGPYSGLIADRVDRRKLMIILQSVMGVLALILGLLAVTHTVRLWHIFVIAGLLGLTDSFENPARQAFVFEAVGPTRVREAVSLNTVLTGIARATGPALGALLLALFGIGICFLLNAVSFVAVVASLVLIDASKLEKVQPAPRSRGQLRDGFAYVVRKRSLWVPIAMMALIGTFTWEYPVTLPPMSERVFHWGATGYGLMNLAQGTGSFVGGLTVAKRGRTGAMFLTAIAAVFSLAVLATALAPNMWLEMIFLLVVGATGTSFIGAGNATLQVETAPQMRGRVMSLWAMAFQGSTPIGGPIAGYVANEAGARISLVMGAAAAVAATVLGLLTRGSADPVPESDEVAPVRDQSDNRNQRDAGS